MSIRAETGANDICLSDCLSDAVYCRNDTKVELFCLLLVYRNRCLNMLNHFIIIIEQKDTCIGCVVLWCNSMLISMHFRPSDLWTKSKFLVWSLSGFKNGPRRLRGPEFTGRWPRDEGFPNGKQESRRQWCGFETKRTKNNDKSETIGDFKDSLLTNTETHKAYKRTTCKRNWIAYEGYTGKKYIWIY